MSVTSIEAKVEVLIVGAGPVGLMLANQLGLRGVRTLVVERNASTVHEPRAIGYDDETFRTLQSVGLSERFAAHVVPDLPFALLNKKNKQIVRMQLTERPYGHSAFGSFYQPTLERMLAEGLARFESVDLRFEHELVSFEQRDTGVDATVREATGREIAVQASWLIGCDGGTSGVREALGLSFAGSTYNERWLVIDCRNDPFGRQEANFLSTAGRPTVSLPAPEGRRRWEFVLFDHENKEEMCSDETIARLLAHYHDPKLAEIERRVVYTFHARFASQFRVGRVLLAGDAAHVMPPFAGQGMNSGIRDAFNLGWKLALVTHGRAKPDLLDSYEQERRWHVRRMTQLAIFLGWAVMPTGGLRMAFRDAFFGVLDSIPPTREFLRSGKIRPAPSLGRRGLFCASSTKTAGTMLPQIDAELEDGSSIPLDDLIGDGFAVVGVDVDPLRHHDAWTRLARQLGARSICIHTGSNRDATRNRDTIHVVDPSGVFGRKEYRANPDILVRPDRFVMAAVRDAHRSDTAATVSAMLQLNPVPERRTESAHPRPVQLERND